MAASESYFNDDYLTIDRALERAQSLGARRVGVVAAGWQESPLGPCYEVTAEVETSDGRTCRRLGRARPGDSKAPNAAPAEADDQVETRAEARAVRAAIKTAYPTAELDADAQPPHVKRAQALVRKASEAMRISRDQLAAIVHERYEVESINDLTAVQVDLLAIWLEPFVSGEEG